VVDTAAIHGYSLISVSDPPTILEVLFFPHLHPAAVVVAPAAVVEDDGDDAAADDGDDAAADDGDDAAADDGDDTAAADDGDDAAAADDAGGVNVLEGGTTFVVICCDTVPL